jgi:hypothetical protein
MSVLSIKGMGIYHSSDSMIAVTIASNKTKPPITLTVDAVRKRDIKVPVACEKHF